MMGSKKCAKCDKSIYNNDPQLPLGGNNYHKGCARCATCDKQLTIKNFSTSGDRLLCKTHFKEEFSHGGGVYAGDDKFKHSGTSNRRVVAPVSILPTSSTEEQSPVANTGLVKRQSSISPDPSANSLPDGNFDADVDIEMAQKDTVPLIKRNSSDQYRGSDEQTPVSSQASTDKMFIFGHMGLALLFLMAGSSIVPLFAAAEDESWRTKNIPYQKTASGDVILDLRLNQPLVDPPTISSRFLIFSAIIVPLAFVVCINLFNFAERKFRPIQSMSISQLHELRAGVCALLVSVGLSETITCTLKLYVSRNRPNFYQLCGFDPETLKCMAPLSHVHEASLSFPSGHSSLSFGGMTFIMYFLLGRLALLTASSSLTLSDGRKIQLLPYKSLLGVFCVLGPWSWSVFVACSRIVDNWHHPDDVVAGTLLGIAAATVGYHAFYPSTSAAAGLKAGIPLSLQQ